MTKLRETIAYNKDLITGWVKTIKKFKDVDSQMINTMTIELFNAETGEKVYEAKAENVINNFVSKIAYMDYFYYRIKGSISTTQYPSPPWQSLVLTDYSGSEEANNNFIRGNLIGYADKTTPYAGGDSQKGTINIAETKLDTIFNGVLHFVFDFPTNAANGTFQTVWWAYSKGNMLGVTAYNSHGNNNNYCTVFNGGIIERDSTTYTVGGTLNKYSLDSCGTTGTIVPTNMPAMTMSGMDYDGTNVWIADVLVSKKLHKFTADMSTWISSVNITGWNTALWGNTIDDITECVGIIYALSYNYYIVPIDKATGVCGTGIDIRARCGLSSTYYDSDGGITSNGVDRIYVIKSVYIYVLDNNLNYIAMLTYSVESAGLYKASYDRSTNNMYVRAYYPYPSYSLVKFNIESSAPGAQNLLAAPITKTATNTMKIQYDFQIQKVL